MTKKEKCKEIMKKLFGEATASEVDSMTEDNCVEKCKDKVRGLLGNTIAENKFKEVEE